MMFNDREHAALLLADRLTKYKNHDAVVLAIPRGGVPMGYIIANQLLLPLDIVLVKKIGHPGNPEYAIGSVSFTETVLKDTAGISQEYIQSEIERLRNSMKEKYKLFMENREPVPLIDQVIILVDDGLATGNTMQVCIEHIRKSKPSKIVVAVPVSSVSAYRLIHNLADEIICLDVNPEFYAVGQFYENFSEVNDTDVTRLLQKASADYSEKAH